MNRLFLYFFAICLFFFSCAEKKKEFGTDISSDAELIRRGKALFELHCSNCHNFEGDAIGPNLSGITRSVEREWIENFIQNPARAIENQDPRALKLASTFSGEMPGFSFLTAEEVNALLSYLHTYEGLPLPSSGDTTSTLIPEKVADSGIRVELELFTSLPPSDSVPPLAKMTKMELVPGTDRLFINDQRIGLYEIIHQKPRLYLSLLEKFPKLVSQPGWATGLGSFAFHPDFEKNGLFYTSHTEPGGSAPSDFGFTDSLEVFMQWVLVEWKAKNPQAGSFEGTYRELLRVDNASQAHGMQELAFHPNAKKGEEEYGLLYLGYGDGGTAEKGFPSISLHEGKGNYSSIWRIDPQGKNSKNGKYGIPTSNPFASQKEGREVYAYGFRNPNRLFWDDKGQLFATDIGQHSIEEINRIQAGGFYGWPIREGKFVVNPYGNFRNLYPLPKEEKNPPIYPLLQLEHDEMVAIIGGYFSKKGKLKDKFLFGDVPSGRLFLVDLQSNIPVPQTWGIRFQGKEMSLKTLVNHSRVDLKFGQDASGNTYLMSKTTGAVYRIVE
ncbi:MAG: hypothetical protein RL407_996 [Bacteroidota bacterium]|jgi:glucose/arabinose dehydrogenase